MTDATQLPTRQLYLDLKMSIPVLRPGDIIATSTESKPSGLIQGVTDSPFSHAILYRGNERAVDSTPDRGTVVDSILEKLANAKFAAVFRHKSADPAQCELAAKWASLQAGLPYDHIGAARVGLHAAASIHLTRYGYVAVKPPEDSTSIEDHDLRFFCSELIARAYEIAGAPIIDSPAHLITPGHLLVTNRLVYMGNLTEIS